MSICDIDIYPKNIEFKIDLNNIHIIIVRKHWHYKIIYPDGTSEIYFLHSSLEKQIKKLMSNYEEMYSWIDL